MKVLISGANGFLGRHVVAAFLARGHEVRALVRRSTDIGRLGWEEHRAVEVFRCDLRGNRNLLPAFEDVDVLVHLAAQVVGDDDTRFVSTVVGTEKLLAAMAKSETRRLVLASSYAVYDYDRVESKLTEESPFAERPYDRDGYAIAKVWQERLARECAQENQWDLRVIRPGFIWGRGNEWLAGCGLQMGHAYGVINPLGPLPLTHVENCADAFAAVGEHDGAANETFNLVDSHGVSNWRYVQDYREGLGVKARRIPIPYWLGLLGALGAKKVSRILFGANGKLPSLFIPCRFRARFRTPESSHSKLTARLGWNPPLSYAQCLERTYVAEAPSELGRLSRRTQP